MTTVEATSTLLGMLSVGVVSALVAAFRSQRARRIASVVGWLGLVGGAVALYAGEGLFAPAAIPTAFGMAASGALAVMPAAGRGGRVQTAAAVASALVAGVGLYGGIAYAGGFEPTPWDAGAVLIGVHWAALGAAAASGLAGAFMVLSWAFLDRAEGDAESDDSTEAAVVSALELRARGRDAAGRAVALVWMAWPVARLIHWRFLGNAGIGTRSEWFAIGITLLATGGLLVGWDLGESRNAKVRSVVGPVFVAAAIVSGIWVSFGFGSPFALSIGS